MKLSFEKIVLSFVLIIIMNILISCAAKPIGYGLVLWSDEKSRFWTGAIVHIMKESQIQKAYLVRFGASMDLMEIPFWRVRLYPTVEEAEKGARSYAENTFLYGYSEKDGLPIRDEPSQEARRIYKLRAGQLVKILSKGKEKVEIADYEDYWYDVLTGDGFEGFCFGVFLNIFSTQGDPQEEVKKLMAKDPVLDRLLSTVWRPEYFQEMVEAGRIDLFRFSNSIGFFPNRRKNQIQIITSKTQQIFDYEEIENVGHNRYRFIGTDLRIHIVTDKRMVLTYSMQGQLISSVYVRFDEDIGEIIASERTRRNRLFREFIIRGRVLQSTAYGIIQLKEGMRFLWQDFERLSSQVFLKQVEGSGAVDFPYFLSVELSSRFDGIITFHFKEYSQQEGTSFLYAFDNKGVRFMFIPPENIVNLEAVGLGISPSVIYFTFSE